MLSQLLVLQVGDMATAISSLEAYLDTMSRGMDQTGPAIACCSLGILFYNKVGLFQQQRLRSKNGTNDQPKPWHPFCAAVN
jgi:hypothetical protein